MLSSLTSYCVWFKLFILFVDLFKVFGEFNVSFDDSDLSFFPSPDIFWPIYIKPFSYFFSFLFFNYTLGSSNLAY